jgi:hypothetical protein
MAPCASHAPRHPLRRHQDCADLALSPFGGVPRARAQPRGRPSGRRRGQRLPAQKSQRAGQRPQCALPKAPPGAGWTMRLHSGSVCLQTDGEEEGARGGRHRVRAWQRGGGWDCDGRHEEGGGATGLALLRLRGGGSFGSRMISTRTSVTSFKVILNAFTRWSVSPAATCSPPRS